MEGFEISAMQMLNLDKPSAEEFFEIYKVFFFFFFFFMFSNSGSAIVV